MGNSSYRATERPVEPEVSWRAGAVRVLAGAVVGAGVGGVVGSMIGGRLCPGTNAGTALIIGFGVAGAGIGGSLALPAS